MRWLPPTEMSQASSWSADIESALIALITEFHERGESIGSQPLNSWQGWLQTEGYDATNLESFFLDPERLDHWQGEPSLAAAFQSAIDEGTTTADFLNALSEQQPTYLNHTIEAADALVTQQQHLMTTAGGTQATQGLLGRTGMSKGGADTIRVLGGLAFAGAVTGALYYKFGKNRGPERGPEIEPYHDDADIFGLWKGNPNKLDYYNTIETKLKDRLNLLNKHKIEKLKEVNEEYERKTDKSIQELKEFAEGKGGKNPELEDEFNKRAKEFLDPSQDNGGEISQGENYLNDMKESTARARQRFANAKFEEIQEFNLKASVDKYKKTRDYYDNKIEGTESLIKRNETEKLSRFADEKISAAAKEVEKDAKKELTGAIEDIEADIETDLTDAAGDLESF